MTIASTNQKKLYSGNDSTTIFAYDFRINDEDHLDVQVADADDDATVLVITTNYTVSGVGEAAGGNVTLEDLTAICGQATLPTGWSISINRVPPILQSTDLENQGAFFAETHESHFDYITMIALYLQEQIDRSLKVTITSGDDGSVLDEDFSAILTDCQTARTGAEAAETAAGVAQTAAETAQTNAETAETNAETAETNAETAETNAETAATAAAAARDSVVISEHTETASASQNTITVSGFTLDTNTKNIQIYIDGLRQYSFTRTSGTVITLGAALSGGEEIMLHSATPSAGGSIDIATHEAVYAHVGSIDAGDFTTSGGALALSHSYGSDFTTSGATFVLGASGVTAATYGLPAAQNVDAKGRITSVREAVITDLPAGSREVQEDLVFDSTCFSGRSAGDDLCENVLKLSLIWDLEDATLIGFDSSVDAADTGASGPSVNIEINGVEALSADLTLTETEAAGSIKSDGSEDIVTGERYEITVATTGTNSDAEDAHVRLLWRVTG